MKKVLLFLTLAVVSLAVTAQQLKPQHVRLQAPVAQKAAMAENTLEFGYCGDLAQNLGFGMKGTFRALMKVTAADATKFAGAKIVAVKAGVGSFSVNPGAQIVILSDLNGSYPVYSQEFTPTKQDWNEVTLDTPYTLDSKEFYVGYQIYASSSQNYPFGIDDQQANPNGDIVGYLDEESGSYQYLSLGSQGFGNNCIKIVLSGDNLPKYDLAIEDLTVKQYITTGSEFSISATVKNAASEAINTFDVAYQIGNADPVVSTVTLDAPLANTQSYTFSIDKLVINEDGAYDVTVTVSNPNGHADEYEADNSMTKAVTALSTLVPRKVLLENFSTAQCGNCPRVHEFIKGILKDRSDVAWVVHHTGYGTDTYTISESEKYLWFYGGGGTYAPAAMLDRRCLKELNAQGAQGVATAPVFFPESKESLTEFINYCAEQPAFISINITDVYNEETRELTVRVTGESTAELAVAPNINIFLTEDGLKGYQSGGGNSYPHSHAIRKVMTSTWGDQLTFDNNKFDVTYTCKLDEDWKAENMSVIAFVADFNEKNYNECMVHNTEFKVLEYGAAVGKLTNDQCRVMSINKTVNFTGKYNNAAVYTIDGRLVQVANGKACITLDNAGVYIVVVDGVSHKVVVK
jgi:hypothetical protein